MDISGELESSELDEYENCLNLFIAVNLKIVKDELRREKRLKRRKSAGGENGGK